MKNEAESNREDFLSEMGERFDEGLLKMTAEGSDVFAFSYDVNETQAPQTVVVLIRPKAIADEMLAAIEFMRSQASPDSMRTMVKTVEFDSANDSAKPTGSIGIDPYRSDYK